MDPPPPDTDAARRAVRLATLAVVGGTAATTEPVVAAGLAWLLHNQSLGAAPLAGGGLVTGGVILDQFRRS